MFDLLLTKRIGLVLCALLVIGPLAAQESPSPPPSGPERNIRISFVPPPLDGTISLGIYDAKGKLIRVLFREADINEFTIGSDALSTSWDGKDDAGDNAPPGKYSAHGFVVGDLKIEGVGFFFNDWISSAEGPRFSHIRSLAMHDENLLLSIDLVPPAAGHVLYDVADKTVKLKDTDADPKPPTSPAATASDIDPIATVPGRDGSRWVIDRTEKGASTIEVKQFSSKGDFLRRLPVSPNEPQPKAIAASLNGRQDLPPRRRQRPATGPRPQPGRHENRRERTAGLGMESGFRKIDRGAPGIFGRGRQSRGGIPRERRRTK